MYLLLFLTGLLNFGAQTDSMPTEPSLLYLTTDLGDHWQPFDNGLPKNIDLRKVVELEDKLFLLTMSDGIYVLPKGATAWKSSSAGLAKEVFSSCMAAKGNLVVLGTFKRGVYVSNDGGANWRRPFFNLKNVSVRSLLFHDNALLAATDMGIWRSFDNGETWRQDGTDHTLINELAIHNGQVYVAKQNGMGILKGKEIEWADVKTEWAIGKLFSEGKYIYAIPAKGNIIRSKDGVNWENQQFHIKCTSAQNLPEALWDGYQPDLPMKGDMPATIFTTKRGWIAGMRSGC
jgi:photosystem II stability/assembly factor-like uncharacterized protein